MWCMCFVLYYLHLFFFFLLYKTLKCKSKLETETVYYMVLYCVSLCYIVQQVSPRAHLHVVGMLRFMTLTFNEPSLPTPFYSVLVPFSVFMALSTVFHSINSPDNSPLSHSVLQVLFLPYWSFQLYISLRKLPSALI